MWENSRAKSSGRSSIGKEPFEASGGAAVDIVMGSMRGMFGRCIRVKKGNGLHVNLQGGAKTKVGDFRVWPRHIKKFTEGQEKKEVEK